MKPAHIALAVLVMAVWASNIAAARFAASEIPGWALITVRMMVIAVSLLPFVSIPRGYMWKIFWLSVTMGTLHFGLMFVAIQHIYVGTAALIIQTSVPFALLLALLFFRERFGWYRAAGILISFFGVALVVGEPRLSDSLLYAFMALISALAFGGANLQLRALGGVSVFAINGWMAVFAIPQMTLMSILFETGQFESMANASLETWLAILHMGIIVSIVGHGLWYQMVPKYQTNQTMPFTLLIPLFGVSMGIVLLGETLNWHIIVGGLIIIFGVAIIVFRGETRDTPATQWGRSLD
ncbi:MAG: multidrug DMT transporter permease [Rhodospirillaceae bacterium]|nr:multidrug DMT transporter permease [Rhodospirillaceae bacterium]|tara:strand:+ start:2797 stop:3684 length:888 start_codon:yes stop_codon:yes gene_type:complete